MWRRKAARRDGEERRGEGREAAGRASRAGSAAPAPRSIPRAGAPAASPGSAGLPRPPSGGPGSCRREAAFVMESAGVCGAGAGAGDGTVSDPLLGSSPAGFRSPAPRPMRGQPGSGSASCTTRSRPGLKDSLVCAESHSSCLTTGNNV